MRGLRSRSENPTLKRQWVVSRRLDTRPEGEVWERPVNQAGTCWTPCLLGLPPRCREKARAQDLGDAAARWWFRSPHPELSLLDLLWLTTHIFNRGRLNANLGVRLRSRKQTLQILADRSPAWLETELALLALSGQRFEVVGWGGSAWWT